MKRGLTAEDQEIADRLQKLHRNPEAPLTEEQLEERLAKLRGHENVKESNPRFVDKGAKPNPIQADDLFRQMQDEIELEKNLPEQDDEIAERLARLKGVDVEAIKSPRSLVMKDANNGDEGATAIDPESFLSGLGPKEKPASEKPAITDDDPIALLKQLSRDVNI